MQITSPTLRKFLRAAVLASIATAIFIIVCAAWIALPLPSAMREPRVVPSLTITDRNGLPLRTTRSPDGVRGGWISIAEIDPDVIRAFVAAEDRRFYDHHGVDPRAIGRALRDNIRSGRIVSGASTITMQTVRLLRGTPRSWPGKVAQALWALRLDAHLSKNQILEQYLNLVPLGQGTVGVPAAARLYFNGSASELSLGQAAMLAGIARVPARDNPIRSQNRARERRTAVLASMRLQGFIATDEQTRAANEPVMHAAAATNFLAPHFTTQLLARTGETATGMIRASIDLELQRALEAEVRHTVNTLQDRAAKHAAAVVLDNRSGDVLAWVGSPDFFADTAGQVDMVISARQPGSALKPFLYGLAFDRGFTASSVLPDVPRTYPTSTGPYEPQNYDRTFRGPVRAREALASSYNVPAVELAERMGAAALLSTLHDAGFALTRTAEHYGLGLALGNGDVTLLELANAYRGIANGGVWRPYRMQTDAPKSGEQMRFMSSHAAALVLDILSDPVARIPGFGAATPLDFPFPAAAKTGTSRHFTDNWAVATTANFTVAVWVGNFSGRPMQGVSGITGAGPLLHRAVLQTAERYSPGYLVRPDEAGLVASNVCILSGMRATSECPSMLEWFAPGTEPIAYDDWQRDGRTVLPPEYAEWAAQKSRTDLRFAADTESPVSQSRAQRILSPLDGDRYQRPIGVDARYATIPLVAGGADAVGWLIDGRPIASARWQLTPGTHIITATWPSGVRDSVRVVVE